MRNNVLLSNILAAEVAKEKKMKKIIPKAGAPAKPLAAATAGGGVQSNK